MPAEGIGMAAPGASDTVIVVTGGDPVDRAALAHLPADALVIAADSGIEHAQDLGLTIDVAIGDFDSVAPSALEAAVAAGATVERHPEAKDATDLELALDAALLRGARCVHVLGGHGGRLDHLLANALLLAAPRYAAAGLVAHMGAARVTVVRDEANLTGSHGDIVTLLAVGGPALGVTTSGLLYPLHDDDLLPGSTRGVSNELTRAEGGVRVRGGVLLAVQPGQTGTHQQRTTTR
jgi:thiamine pyrophosphokinase